MSPTIVIPPRIHCPLPPEIGVGELRHRTTAANDRIQQRPNGASR